MVIKSPAEFGLALRDRRRRLSISQAELANRIGVSRSWVVTIERRNDAAELGLVLRAVRALDLILDLGTGAPATRQDRSVNVDIDAIVRRGKEEAE